MTDLIQQNALYIFTQDWSRLSEIKLHLKGTDFQLKVWETLLKVPMGGLTTYSRMSRDGWAKSENWLRVRSVLRSATIPSPS